MNGQLCSSFSAVLPCGKIFDGLSLKEAKTYLPWMPAGSRIEPPIPPGNQVALQFLDNLIFHHAVKSCSKPEAEPEPSVRKEKELGETKALAATAPPSALHGESLSMPNAPSVGLSFEDIRNKVRL